MKFFRIKYSSSTFFFLILKLIAKGQNSGWSVIKKHLLAFYFLLREPIPRQADKKSWVPKDEKWVLGSQGGDRVWNSKGGKNKRLFFFFLSTFLSLGCIKCFFALSPELIITQQPTQFKICTKNYITTMYPAWG